MKKFFSYLTLIVGMLFLTFNIGCGLFNRQYVEPGYVGVRVYLHGSSKGVDHEVVGAGRYYVGMNEKLYLFPVFLQNYNYTQSANEGRAMDESFSFQDKQGMTIKSDVGISYAFDKNRIDDIFTQFHSGPDEITNVFLRSLLRDAFNRAASTREIQDIYGPGKSAFVNEVQADVQKRAAIVGVNVKSVLLINELRLPDQIIKALNDKTAATQRAMQSENELRVTQAEAAKTVAQAEGYAKALLVKGNAEATYNRQISASITPVLVDKMKAEKWDGKLPQVQGGGTPFISLGGLK